MVRAGIVYRDRRYANFHHSLDPKTIDALLFKEYRPACNAVLSTNEHLHIGKNISTHFETK